MLKFFRQLSPSVIIWRHSRMLNICKLQTRSFADDKPPTSSSKQIVVQGNESEQIRVRRVLQSDTPRLLRFVRTHPRSTWPGLFSSPEPAPSAASYLILSDYVARILAQGHSMVAEQLKSRRGWTSIHGLALTAALCPWDAALLQRWAQCVRCARSKRFLHFTAVCLQAPQLHEKYHVHKILQVVLILPPESVKSTEVVQMLARSAIQRGREVGCPLIRFDVANETVAKALEDLNLTKEWHLSYQVLPERVMEDSLHPNTDSMKRGNFVTVYTAFTIATQTETKSSPPSDPLASLPALTTTKPTNKPADNSTATKNLNSKTSSTNLKTQSITNAAKITTINSMTNPIKILTSNAMPNSASNTANMARTKEKNVSVANSKINPRNNSTTNAPINTKTIPKTKKNTYRTPDMTTDSLTNAGSNPKTINPTINPTIGCSIRWIGPTIDPKTDSINNLQTCPKIVPTINPATITPKEKITSKNDTTDNNIKNSEKVDQTADSTTSSAMNTAASLKKVPKINPATNNDSHSTKHVTDNPAIDK